MKKFKIILAGLVLIVFAIKAQDVKTIEVKPVGVYAEINIKGQNRMLQLLYDTQTRNAAIDTIFNNITHFNPPVIYLFSQALFLNGEKQSAVEWYLYAQINAMYDAARCVDNTAKQAVMVLEERTQPTLDEYMKKNKPIVTESARKVIQLFNSLQPDYDNRWINLHGLGAFDGAFGEELPKEAPKLTEDKSLWPSIKAKVLKEFTETHGVREIKD